MIVEDRTDSIEISDQTVISNRKLVVTGLVKVASSGQLVIESSELVFEKGAGILCEGVVRFANSAFAASDNGEYWNGISLSGDGAAGSIIDKCVFTGANCPDTEEARGGALTVISVEARPVTLRDCTFSDCSGNFGGAVCVHGTLVPGETEMPAVSVIFEGCRFENCKGLNGGALALIYRARVEASRCQFVNCEGKTAGAVYLYDNSFLTAKNSSFERCRAEISGGAISSRFSTLDLSRSSVKSCVGSRNNTQGGAYYLEKSNSKIAGDRFWGCQAEAGGALRPVGGILKLERCEFENCVAAVSGGAIAFSRDCESEIKGCKFKACSKKSPTGTGNTIAFKNSNGKLRDCVFSDCQSGIAAQEVAFDDDSSVKMVNCEFPKKSLWATVLSLFKNNS